MDSKFHGINSIGFDFDSDEYYEPTTEELLKFWEESQLEYGKPIHKKPSHEELISLWKEACSEYKIKTRMALAERKHDYDHNPVQSITADELRAAFNQSFEEFNGTGFDSKKCIKLDTRSDSKSCKPSSPGGSGMRRSHSFLQSLHGISFKEILNSVIHK